MKIINSIDISLDLEDLIEKIFSIVNDMLPFVDPEFFEDTGEEVTE